MKPINDIPEMVWERTLPQIRMTRSKRRQRRIVMAVASVCALSVSWLAMHTRPPADQPVVYTPPEPAVVETLAVMRVSEDGSMRLEEISSKDLGSIELAFGLTPVVTDDFENW